MPITLTKIQRVFTFKEGKDTITLPDPNPQMNEDDVMSHYASTYPHLTTATVGAPKIEGDKAVYEFTSTIGTKG